MIDRYTKAPPADIWKLGDKQKIARVCTLRPVSPSPPEASNSAGQIALDFGLSNYTSYPYKTIQSDVRPLKRAKTDLGRAGTEKRRPHRRTTTKTRKNTTSVQVNI